MKMVLTFRNVQAALDDRRRHQDVGVAAHKLDHRLLQLVLVHLAVADDDTGLGHDLLQAVRDVVDVVDAVVDEVDLAVAVQLADDGVADQLMVEADNPRLDRQAVARRRLQVADVADAQERQVQRARDRRRRQRQDVHGLPQAFSGRSLCSTPKRCSSSMTTRPRSLKRTSALTRRWVPMMMSTPPLSRRWTVRFC